MVDVATVASVLGGAVEAAKEIGNLTRGAKDRKVNEHVLDLQQRLIEVQGLVLGLSAENQSLTGRIEELERASQLAGDMVYEQGEYWLVKDGKRDGPFCPGCWDNHRRAIHIGALNFGGVRTCPVCRAHV